MPILCFLKHVLSHWKHSVTVLFELGIHVSENIEIPLCRGISPFSSQCKTKRKVYISKFIFYIVCFVLWKINGILFQKEYFKSLLAFLLSVDSALLLNSNLFTIKILWSFELLWEVQMYIGRRIYTDFWS